MADTAGYIIALANWGVNISFWSAAVFILCVGIIWPFWKSFWGMNIVLLELAIALALLPAILARDFGLHVFSSAVALWIQVVALWLVGIIIIWRGGLIITEQIKAVRRPRSSPHRDEKRLIHDDDEKKCQQ